MLEKLRYEERFQKIIHALKDECIEIGEKIRELEKADS
jgi:hypothetical protein